MRRLVSFSSSPFLSLDVVMRDLYGRKGREFKLRKISRSRWEIDEIDFLVVINISREKFRKEGESKIVRVLIKFTSKVNLYLFVESFSIEIKIYTNEVNFIEIRENLNRYDIARIMILGQRGILSFKILFHLFPIRLSIPENIVL